MAMPMEVELKIALAPRHSARLAGDPLIGDSGEPARSLDAIYYDTPAHALSRRGVALRLRQDRGSWTQAIKGGGSVQAGLHRRVEIETPVEVPLPDLARVADSDLGKLALRAVGRGKLVPVFRVTMQRLTRVVSPAPGVTIEVSLDRGVIRAGKARITVSEVELELQAGPAWRLFEFALRIAERYPVRIEHRSKAERGYALARGISAAPVKAQLGVVRRRMTAAEAFKAVCWTCINHMQANYAGVLRGADPEYLHQMRVALRRLRSGLGAFEALLPPGAEERPVAAVQRLAHALGPARDWDVFVEATLTPLMKQFPEHYGLGRLERACVRLRQSAHRAANFAVASPDYQRLVLSMGGWLTEEPWTAELTPAQVLALKAPVTGHAKAVLERDYQRIRKRGRSLAQLDFAQTHRLRIAAKKLRYAAGFFALLFSRERVQPMLEALNDLQDVLGAINDSAMAQVLIKAAARESGEPLRRQPRAIVRDWTQTALEHHRRALRRSWKAFRACDHFWR